MQIALSHTKLIRLVVALSLVVSAGAAALTLHTAYSATWPNCNWTCSANDVTLNRVYLGAANGTALEPCTEGGTVTAYVWGNFTNGTGTNRYAVWLIFDLWINGSLANSTVQCDLDMIAPGSVLGQLWGPFSWECGQQVGIKNLIVSWVGTSDT